MSRTKNSIKNMLFSSGGQIITLLCNFVARKVFIVYLGKEYLGLSGVFGNLLSMLSLAELGVGTAIAFALYQPLATSNQEETKSIMNLFRRIYYSIGCIIAVLGIILTFFLNHIIGDVAIEHVQLLFLLYVFNSSISYFYSYKATLINADQKKYIVTLNNNIFKVVLDVVQCGVLILTGNFILYLVVQIIVTIISNIVLSRQADKMYPYLKDKNVARLNSETVHGIVKNIGAMIFHKVGNVMVNATDSLIISRFVSLASAGLYSNYTLITNAINNFEWLIYYSITASVGNYNVTETKERKEKLFSFVYFVNYITTGFCTVALWTLFNPFISWWVGKDMLLSDKAVVLICSIYFINGMRKSVITFRDALGLYWQDRYKSIFESIINLVVSIVLATKFGIVGVLLGTIISAVTTCAWIEPYVLYHFGLTKNVILYFKKYALYLGKLLITVACVKIPVALIYVNGGFLDIVLKAIAVVFIYTIVTVLLNFRNEEFKKMKVFIMKLKR